MHVTCLVPSYNRPDLLRSSIGMFLGQDQGFGDKYKMLILEDSGIFEDWYYEDQLGRKAVSLVSTETRYGSLPAKYNKLLELDNNWADIYVVWDDDDLYLPIYLNALVKAQERAGMLKPAFYHPANVLSMHTWIVTCERQCVMRVFDYCGDDKKCRLCGAHVIDKRIDQERATGRFHGTLAVSSTLMSAINGWEDTKRADFDQRMITRCAENGMHIMPDLMVGFPLYIYGWRRAQHCSLFMASPDNTNWYDNYGRATKPRWMGGEQPPKINPENWMDMQTLIEIPIVDPSIRTVFQSVIDLCSDEQLKNQLSMLVSRMYRE